MWLIVALVLLVMFGGGMFYGLGNLVYILLLLAIISAFVHLFRQNN